LVNELKQKKEIGILDQPNFEFLIKLIKKAESQNEIVNIITLGTHYYKTGLKFSPKLEKETSNIHYFEKNINLSFKQIKGERNKLIIGDNYHALQNLLISHRNKIDIIYIDPPYGCNNMGEGAKTNFENAHLSRDHLLSSLKPRLELAKQLLTENGVIFCSIDDKNQAYVKCLFDDIFGEKNFLCNFI
jgi:adenine-specific DNA-methyltransferase